MSKKFKIQAVRAREIMDSNGKPSVAAEVETDFGIFQSAVPSGISAGKYEAVELRDEDGGVKKAIENVEQIIAPVLESEVPEDQGAIDEMLLELDGTEKKEKLGANAMLAVSIAVCRALAKYHGLPLYKYIRRLAGREADVFNMPKPSFNMIEGGKHAENNLAFQEFMAVPWRASFRDNLSVGKEIHKTIKEILEERYGKKIIYSAEGAFSAPIEKVSDALDLIIKAVEIVGGSGDIKIAIDAAASEFLSADGGYSLDGNFFFKEELMIFYNELMNKYPILSIEDPFHEEDFDSFSLLRKEAGEVIIIGDDLTVSNIERIKMAEEKKACSGLILKPNQIGTIIETIEAAKRAQSFGWKIMVSNRAGETEDDFIADLAVGIGAEFIKSGAPFPKERMAKYNRLVKIEEELCRN